MWQRLFNSSPQKEQKQEEQLNNNLLVKTTEVLYVCPFPWKTHTRLDSHRINVADLHSSLKLISGSSSSSTSQQWSKRVFMLNLSSGVGMSCDPSDCYNVVLMPWKFNCNYMQGAIQMLVVLHKLTIASNGLICLVCLDGRLSRYLARLYCSIQMDFPYEFNSTPCIEDLYASYVTSLYSQQLQSNRQIVNAKGLAYLHTISLEFQLSCSLSQQQFKMELLSGDEERVLWSSYVIVSGYSHTSTHIFDQAVLVKGDIEIRILAIVQRTTLESQSKIVVAQGAYNVHFTDGFLTLNSSHKSGGVGILELTSYAYRIGFVGISCKLLQMNSNQASDYQLIAASQQETQSLVLHKIIVNSIPVLMQVGSGRQRIRPLLEIFGYTNDIAFNQSSKQLSLQRIRTLLYSSDVHLRNLWLLKGTSKRSVSAQSLHSVESEVTTATTPIPENTVYESEFNLDHYLVEDDDPVYVDSDFIFFRLSSLGDPHSANIQKNSSFNMQVGRYDSFEVKIYHWDNLERQAGGGLKVPLCRYEFFPFVDCDSAGLVRVNRPEETSTQQIISSVENLSLDPYTEQPLSAPLQSSAVALPSADLGSLNNIGVLETYDTGVIEVSFGAEFCIDLVFIDSFRSFEINQPLKEADPLANAFYLWNSVFTSLKGLYFLNQHHSVKVDESLVGILNTLPAPASYCLTSDKVVDILSSPNAKVGLDNDSISNLKRMQSNFGQYLDIVSGQDLGIQHNIDDLVAQWVIQSFDMFNDTVQDDSLDRQQLWHPYIILLALQLSSNRIHEAHTWLAEDVNLNFYVQLCLESVLWFFELQKRGQVGSRSIINPEMEKIVNFVAQHEEKEACVVLQEVSQAQEVMYVSQSYKTEDWQQEDTVSKNETPIMLPTQLPPAPPSGPSGPPPPPPPPPPPVMGVKSGGGVIDPNKKHVRVALHWDAIKHQDLKNLSAKSNRKTVWMEDFDLNDYSVDTPRASAEVSVEDVNQGMQPSVDKSNLQNKRASVYGSMLKDINQSINLTKFEELFCEDPLAVKQTAESSSAKDSAASKIVLIEVGRARMISIVLSKFERRLKKTVDVIVSKLLATFFIEPDSKDMMQQSLPNIVLFRIIRCVVQGIEPPWLTEALPVEERAMWELEDFKALQNILPNLETLDAIQSWLKDQGKIWIEQFAETQGLDEFMLQHLGYAELFSIETALKAPLLETIIETRIAQLRYLPLRKQGQVQNDEIQDLLTTIKNISSCLELLKKSDPLKVLLRTVLSLGNLTNHQYSRRAPSTSQAAVGFKIDSLPKLKDVKARDGKSTLINYLVEVLWGVPELLKLPDTFAVIDTVKEFKCTDILNSINELRRTITRLDELSQNEHQVNERLRRLLEKDVAPQSFENRSQFTKMLNSIGQLNTDSEHLKFSLICPVVDELKTKTKSLDLAWNSMWSVYVDTALYFGEDPDDYEQPLSDEVDGKALPGLQSKRKFEDLFQTFSVFFAYYREAVRQVSKVKDRAEKERKKKAQQHSKT